LRIPTNKWGHNFRKFTEEKGRKSAITNRREKKKKETKIRLKGKCPVMMGGHGHAPPKRKRQGEKKRQDAGEIACIGERISGNNRNSGKAKNQKWGQNGGKGREQERFSHKGLEKEKMERNSKGQETREDKR